jgi:hypothetical protein
MIVFVSGASKTLERYAERPWIGSFTQPREGIAADLLERRWRERRWLWACDNDAFNGFDHVRFMRMVARLATIDGLAFLTVPDHVGDCHMTNYLFVEYWHVLYCWDDVEVPLAWVAQDGAESHHMTDECMNLAECVFLGGSTGWKESAAAADLAREARRRGRWVHMGRVNTRRRLKYAFELGCDSVDGSGTSRFPDEMLSRFDRWMAELSPQPLLF